MCLDTDSVFIAVSKSKPFPQFWENNYRETFESAFENIVKEDKISSWREKAPDWFVLTQKKEDKRKPGKTLNFRPKMKVLKILQLMCRFNPSASGLRSLQFVSKMHNLNELSFIHFKL